MRTKITIIAVLACFVVAGNVFAQSAVPANVNGITASYGNDGLTVSWNPVQAENIAFYRIYFSRMSILENQGNYDDYESTPNAQPSYVFPAVPYRGTTLYFSVLAVDADGNESEAFEEEASVVVPPAQTASSGSSVSSVSSSASSPAVSPFVLSHALTTSVTEISLYFTKDMRPEQTVETGSIVILDDAGSRLTVREAVVQGNALNLITDSQNENSLYTVASIGRIIATDGSELLPSTPIAFRGHPRGTDDGTYTSNPDKQDTTPPEDATNLTLRSTLLPNGSYRVTAQWDGSADTQNDLSHYALGSTVNGTDSPEARNEKNELSRQYDNLPPGMFGVMVKAVDLVGNASAGISRSIALPDTGVGILGLMTASGMIAGFRALRKKRGTDA